MIKGRRFCFTCCFCNANGDVILYYSIYTIVFFCLRSKGGAYSFCFYINLLKGINEVIILFQVKFIFEFRRLDVGVCSCLISLAFFIFCLSRVTSLLLFCYVTIFTKHNVFKTEGKDARFNFQHYLYLFVCKLVPFATCEFFTDVKRCGINVRYAINSGKQVKPRPHRPRPIQKTNS